MASSDVVAPLACPPLHGCSKRKGPLKSQLCWVCPFWATVESWRCNTMDSSPKEERHALKPVINRVITTSRDALMPPKKDFFPRHKTGCTQKRHWAAFIEINGAPSLPLRPDFNITSLDGLGRRGATCSVDIKVSFHGNKTKWFLVSDHWSLMKTSHFINLLCYTTQPQTKQILFSCVLQPGNHDITFVFFTLD